MYEKIVIPLDGSKLAEVALPYAEKLAGMIGSEIILLTVLETAETDEYERQRSYIEKVIKATRGEAVKYLVKPDGTAVKIWSATRIGYPADGIINYADKLDIGLIIMATHGRSGITRWAVGSVVDKVVRATKRQPLMLIRASGARSAVRSRGILKKALVPIDGSIRSEVVIPYIKELALKLEAELTLVQVVPQANHVYSDAEGYLGEKCSQFESEGIRAGYEVRIGDVAGEIIKLADEISADLVAMSTRGRSGVSRWALGSVAEKVLQRGTTPLLLVTA